MSDLKWRNPMKVYEVKPPMTRDDLSAIRKEHSMDAATFNYSDPTPDMHSDPIWNAIWDEIKTWDINVLTEYSGYCGATGNHVTAIYLAIKQSCHLNSDNYVAWLRWSGDENHRHLVVCDSDSDSAFKVFRIDPDPPSTRG